MAVLEKAAKDKTGRASANGSGDGAAKSDGAAKERITIEGLSPQNQKQLEEALDRERVRPPRLHACAPPLRLHAEPGRRSRCSAIQWLELL